MLSYEGGAHVFRKMSDPTPHTPSVLIEEDGPVWIWPDGPLADGSCWAQKAGSWGTVACQRPGVVGSRHGLCQDHYEELIEECDRLPSPGTGGTGESAPAEAPSLDMSNLAHLWFSGMGDGH